MNPDHHQYLNLSFVCMCVRVCVTNVMSCKKKKALGACMVNFVTCANHSGRETVDRTVFTGVRTPNVQCIPHMTRSCSRKSRDIGQCNASQDLVSCPAPR